MGWLTRSLHQEGEDIASDKDLRQKAQWDYRASLSIKHGDDPAQGHIDAGSEEGGRDQDEGALHNIWAFGEVWGLGRGEGTADIAHGFHWLIVSLYVDTWVGLGVQAPPMANGIMNQVLVRRSW